MANAGRHSIQHIRQGRADEEEVCFSVFMLLKRIIIIGTDNHTLSLNCVLYLSKKVFVTWLTPLVATTFFSSSDIDVFHPHDIGLSNYM